MTFRIASALSSAQIAASLARADTGTDSAQVLIYATTRPASPGVHSDTPQVTLTLTKPCGAITAGVLALTALAPGLVQATGLPRWAEWRAADGALLADGSVTDAAGDGDFKIAGGETPAGETSPMLYIGALAALAEVALT